MMERSAVTFQPLLIVTELHMGLRVIGITGHVPFLSGSTLACVPTVVTRSSALFAVSV